MHILLITHYYEPEIGAPQRRWSALIERLSAHGHSVTVLCPPPHYPEKKGTANLRGRWNRPFTAQTGSYGEKILRMPYLLHGYSGLTRSLDQLVTAGASSLAGTLLGRKSARDKQEKFDIVVSTVPGLPSLFAGAIVSKALGIPHIAEMRDAWPDVVTGDLTSQTHRIPAHKYAFKQAIFRTVTAGQRSAQAVVVTTEWFSKILTARGVAPVYLVPNGADLEEFLGMNPLSANPERTEDLRIQYLGTVGRSQGLEVLIDALALLRRKRPDLTIRARIIGEGAEVPRLKARAKAQKVDLEFQGTMSRDSLRSAYEWPDVEFISLRKTKPFSWTVPSKIFELLATRRHLLASLEGSAATIIRESGVGTVVEPGNAQALAEELERLAENPHALQVGESGVELLQRKFSYTHMAQNFREIIEATVRDYPASRRQEPIFQPATLSRWAQPLANLALTGQTVSRLGIDDPALLAVQVSRKLPHRVQTKLGALLSHLPGAGLQALGAQLQGDHFPDQAQQLLASPDQPASTLARIQRRICAEVAIGYGHLTWRDENLPPLTRARIAWDMGALTQAIALAEQAGANSYARRLQGEKELLTPGFTVTQGKRLTPKKLTGPAPAIPQQDAPPTAIHLLTNSLPTTQSGYTLRSHRLLQAITHTKNTSITAFTRIGYPVVIGSLLAQRKADIDQISYRRILPTRLAPTHPARLQQWVKLIVRTLEQNPELAGEASARIVHTTTNYPNAVAAQALADALDAPWVYEVRGVMEETWVSNKKTDQGRIEAEASERFGLIRARETELMKAADHVVTLSEIMKNLLVTRGIPAQKITVVPNAVDDSLLQAQLTPAQVRQELNLPPEGFWIGSVSSLVDYEGFDTLLETAAILRQRGQDVRVLLAGDGIARGALEKKARDLGLELGENAIFLGKIAPDQAVLAHQALDVFVVARKNLKVTRSVTPLKPIEAMAVGRVVVASDIPPLAELIHNTLAAPAGLLAEAQNPHSFADAIERLIMNPALAQELIQAGRKFAATRTWSENGRLIQVVYEKLVKERSRGEN